MEFEYAIVFVNPDDFFFSSEYATCRLIQGIVMGIACIYTTKSGVIQILVNHFFTGRQILLSF